MSSSRARDTRIGASYAPALLVAVELRPQRKGNRLVRDAMIGPEVFAIERE